MPQDSFRLAASKEDLGEVIDAQIRASGPITLAEYMSLCLGHPTLGYYRRSNPIGRQGDFITAPEVSQMFGEMVGAFVASAWTALDEPDRFDLVELGPGRGTLLKDVLRAAAGPKGLIEAMRLVLVESSPVLTEVQRRTLAPVEPMWCESVENINPEGPPLIVIANEFFDAMPIRQFQKETDGWHERLVSIGEGKRGFILSKGVLPRRTVPAAIRSAAPGSIWEMGEDAEAAMVTLASRIAKRGGAALVIDYGYEEAQAGDSFQAVAAHRRADPFAAPGEADLTAHVNFEALAEVARLAGAVPRKLMTQAQFLAAMGIVPRAKVLAKGNPDEAEMVNADLRRLTAPDQMGTLFKVLCITAKDFAPYPFVEK